MAVHRLSSADAIEGTGWDLDEARGAYVVIVATTDGTERTALVAA